MFLFLSATKKFPKDAWQGGTPLRNFLD